MLNVISDACRCVIIWWLVKWRVWNHVWNNYSRVFRLSWLRPGPTMMVSYELWTKNARFGIPLTFVAWLLRNTRVSNIWHDIHSFSVWKIYLYFVFASSSVIMNVYIAFVVGYLSMYKNNFVNYICYMLYSYMSHMIAKFHR